MSKDILTFYADVDCIRLIRTRGNTIDKWATLSLDSNAASNTIALSAAVKKIKADNGIKGKKVIASISSMYSVSRILLLSDLNASLTTELAIQEAVVDITGSSLDKTYYSWKTITSGDGRTRVLLVCIPRENVESVVWALKYAGMNPYFIEYKPFALARTIKEKQALIINGESSSYDIILVADGIPEIVRTVRWQYDGLTLEKKVEHLVTNLGLTVDFYRSNGEEDILPIDCPLIIVGGLSKDAKLIEQLKTQVRYSVEPWMPPLQCPPQLPVPDYAVNISLAMNGMRNNNHSLRNYPALPDFNLLPKTYRSWKMSLGVIYIISLSVIGFSLLFFLYLILSSKTAVTHQLQARYDVISKQLNDRQAETKKSTLWINLIRENNVILNKDGNFTDDVKFLYTEAKRMSIQIQSVTDNGKDVTLSYQAEDYIAFRNYAESLRNSGKFSPFVMPKEQYPYIKSGAIKIIPVARIKQPLQASTPAKAN